MSNINKQKTTEQEVQDKKESPVASKNTIVLDGVTYKIKLMSWETGMEVWEHILKRLMPSVGSGLDRLQHNELDGSPTTFTEAFIHLSQNLDGDTLKLFSFDLLEGLTADGKPVVLSEQTTEFMGHWKKLFIFSLKENFKGFFDEGWATSLAEMVSMVTPMMSAQDKV